MISMKEALLLKGGGVVSIVGAGGKTSLMFRLAKALAGDGDPVLTTTTTKILMPTPEQSPCVIKAHSANSVLEAAQRCVTKNLHVTAVDSMRLPQPDKLKGFAPVVIDQLWKAGIFRWVLVEADGARHKPLKAPAEHEPVIPESSKWLIAMVGLESVHKPLDENWVFRPERYAGITGIRPGEPISTASVAGAIIHRDGIMKGCPEHTQKLAFLNAADDNERVEHGRKIAAFLQRQKSSGLRRVIIGQVLGEPPVLDVVEIAKG